MKCTFSIKGLDCANCAARLEREIQKIDGITEATISFMTERLVVDYENDKVLKQMKKVIKKEEPDVTIEEV